MKIAIFAFLISFALQAPALSTIEGVVLDSQDNRPVADVQLTLPKPGGPPLAATTDAEGRFTFAQIPAGSYRLSSLKEGYAPARADGRTLPGNNGIPLTVKSGEPVRGLEIHLIRSAILTGRLLDSSGRPVARARIAPMRKIYDETGTLTMTTLGGVVTDDRGEYRVFGLLPGSYFVFADSVSSNGMATVPTYYPGTTDPDQAAMITLRSGEESRLGDMTVSLFKGVPVLLHIRNEIGLDPQLMVVEVRKDGVTKTNLGIPLPPPNYTLNSVPPGTYDIGVGLQGEEGFLFTHVAARVEDAPVELNVTVNRGRNISGRAESRNSAGVLRPVSGVRITLGISGSADTRSATSDSDGAFVLKGVTEGIRAVRVDSVPADSYLLSVMEADRDILTGGIPITGDTNIHVLIGDSAGSVDGNVVNSEGRKVVDGIVALIPDEPDATKRHLYRTATTDQNGTFAIGSIAPGVYRLYAWKELDGFAYRNADFMKAYEGQGQAVKIEPGGHLSFTLNPLP